MGQHASFDCPASANQDTNQPSKTIQGTNVTLNATKTPTNQTNQASRPVGQSASRPVGQSANRPISQLTNHHNVNQPIIKSANQPINRNNKAVDQPSNRSTQTTK